MRNVLPAGDGRFSQGKKSVSRAELYRRNMKLMYNLVIYVKCNYLCSNRNVLHKYFFIFKRSKYRSCPSVKRGLAGFANAAVTLENRVESDKQGGLLPNFSHFDECDSFFISFLREISPPIFGAMKIAL